MRSSRIIYLLICTNLLALLLWIRERSGHGATDIQAKTIPPLSGPLPSSFTSKTAPAPRQTTKTLVVTNDFRWAQLESEDYRTYISRLRSIGCPDQTIKDIIIADLDKLMAPRIRALQFIQEEPKYWKSDDKELRGQKELLEKMLAKQKIDFEKRQVLQELLGVDLVTERANLQGEEDFYGRRLGFLAPEKRAQVRMIIERAHYEEVSLREKSWLNGDSLTAEERKELLKIQNQKESQIADLLSPDEFDRYNLWFSNAAYHVRDTLAPMNPTEEEFLAVYELQRKFEAAWDPADAANLSPNAKADYEKAKLGLDEQIKERIGPERFEKYEQAQDHDYKQLRITAAQFQLQPEVVSEVFGFKKIVLEQRQRLQNDPAISPSQKEVALIAIGEEAEKAVIETMGAKAYAHYLRSGAGAWVKK